MLSTSVCTSTTLCQNTQMSRYITCSQSANDHMLQHDFLVIVISLSMDRHTSEVTNTEDSRIKGPPCFAFHEQRHHYNNNEQPTTDKGLILRSKRMECISIDAMMNFF